MATDRMNREEFFRAISSHDDAGLRKLLWNLHWRGTADVRPRMEAELAGGRRPAPRLALSDPQAVHDEVAEFVSNRADLAKWNRLLDEHIQA